MLAKDDSLANKWTTVDYFMAADSNIHFNSHNSTDKEAIETLATMNPFISRVMDNMVIIETTAIMEATKMDRTLAKDR